MYKYLIVIAMMLAFAACDDSSTGAEDSKGDSSSRSVKPVQASMEFFCEMENIENGYRQVLNFPNRYYMVTEMTRYGDDRVLLDYDYTFYGKEAYDFPKLCIRTEKESEYYVEGTYSCSNNHLVYKAYDNYREPDEYQEKNTLELFYAEGVGNCESEYEWYLEELNGTDDDN